MLVVNHNSILPIPYFKIEANNSTVSELNKHINSHFSINGHLALISTTNNSNNITITIISDDLLYNNLKFKTKIVVFTSKSSNTNMADNQLPTKLNINNLSSEQKKIIGIDYLRYNTNKYIMSIYNNIGISRTSKIKSGILRTYLLNTTFGTDDDIIMPTSNSKYFLLFKDEMVSGRNPLPQKILQSPFTIHGKILDIFHQKKNEGDILIPDEITFVRGGINVTMGNLTDKILINSRLLSRMVKLYIGPPEELAYNFLRLFLLYYIIDVESGYQYALPSETTSSYQLELFASPFNRTNENYCSLFPQVDKYWGSKGKYPQCLDSQFDTISANPPFIDTFQTDLAERVINKLDQAKNNKKLTYLITMAKWENSTGYKLLVNSSYVKSQSEVNVFINKATGKEGKIPSGISFVLSTP